MEYSNTPYRGSHVIEIENSEIKRAKERNFANKTRLILPAEPQFDLQNENLSTSEWWENNDVMEEESKDMLVDPFFNFPTTMGTPFEQELVSLFDDDEPAFKKQKIMAPTLPQTTRRFEKMQIVQNTIHQPQDYTPQDKNQQTELLIQLLKSHELQTQEIQELKKMVHNLTHQLMRNQKRQ